MRKIIVISIFLICSLHGFTQWHVGVFPFTLSKLGCKDVWGRSITIHHLSYYPSCWVSRDFNRVRLEGRYTYSENDFSLVNENPGPTMDHFSYALNSSVNTFRSHQLLLGVSFPIGYDWLRMYSGMAYNYNPGYRFTYQSHTVLWTGENVYNAGNIRSQPFHAFGAYVGSGVEMTKHRFTFKLDVNYSFSYGRCILDGVVNSSKYATYHPDASREFYGYLLLQVGIGWNIESKPKL